MLRGGFALNFLRNVFSGLGFVLLRFTREGRKRMVAQLRVRQDAAEGRVQTERFSVGAGRLLSDLLKDRVGNLDRAVPLGVQTRVSGPVGAVKVFLFRPLGVRRADVLHELQPRKQCAVELGESVLRGGVRFGRRAETKTARAVREAEVKDFLERTIIEHPDQGRETICKNGPNAEADLLLGARFGTVRFFTRKSDFQSIKARLDARLDRVIQFDRFFGRDFLEFLRKRLEFQARGLALLDDLKRYVGNRIFREILDLDAARRGLFATFKRSAAGERNPDRLAFDRRDGDALHNPVELVKVGPDAVADGRRVMARRDGAGDPNVLVEFLAVKVPLDGAVGVVEEFQMDGFSRFKRNARTGNALGASFVTDVKKRLPDPVPAVGHHDLKALVVLAVFRVGDVRDVHRIPEDVRPFRFGLLRILRPIQPTEGKIGLEPERFGKLKPLGGFSGPAGGVAHTETGGDESLTFKDLRVLAQMSALGRGIRVGEIPDLGGGVQCERPKRQKAQKQKFFHGWVPDVKKRKVAASTTTLKKNHLLKHSFEDDHLVRVVILPFLERDGNRPVDHIERPVTFPFTGI